MDHTRLSRTPSKQIQWREDDGTDVLMVTYSPENLGGATWLTQHSDVELGAPRVLHPLMRAGIARDIARQLQTLKTYLEAQELGTSSREA